MSRMAVQGACQYREDAEEEAAKEADTEERKEHVHKHNTANEDRDEEACANSNTRRRTGRPQRGRPQSSGLAYATPAGHIAYKCIKRHST